MAETDEHLFERLQARQIGVSYFSEKFIGLQCPTANGEFELGVEKVAIQPAIENVEHRLGQRFSIGLRLLDDASRILLSPPGHQCGKQFLAILEEPIKACAGEVEFLGQ